MILQRIQFPQINLCDREEMFFLTQDGVVIDSSSKELLIPRGGTVGLNTYFNSFSIGKWLKYTQIDNLSVIIESQGSLLVSLCSLSTPRDNVVKDVLKQTHVNSSDKQQHEITFDELPQEGILFVQMTALSEEAMVYGGYYQTNCTFTPNKVSIAGGICTFKREKEVATNIEKFEQELINNPNSAAYKNLEIYVSDNGQTLDESISSEAVHLFKNKNLGGAGGFARAMIEILKSGKEYSHILLMDDDILINPDSIERTFIFLQCLKPEYKDAFIGGHMLDGDRKHLQSEAADHWDRVRHHPVKGWYNLEDERLVAENEIEDSVNYLSWWYCCMPIDVVAYDNLPLPLFIKRDDIEYGLRNGKTFITLNGINVWHEPFSSKESAHLQYYYFRNLCIMDAKHRPSLTGDLLKEELKRVVIGRFLGQYKYRNAEFALLGVQDYLKGIDWLKSIDGEGLNAALMKLNYEKKSPEELGWTFQYREFADHLLYEESEIKKAVRGATFNGWLLPRMGDRALPANTANTGLFFRVNKAFNYEDANNVGYITQKNYKCLVDILKMYHETTKLIDERYELVTQEYRERFNELTNIDFWNEYLNRDRQEIVLTSRIDDRVRPDNTSEQRNNLLESYTSRGVQKLLRFAPLKNRIMLHVNERKGFTCSPKYIAKKLREDYGDVYELVWVTSFPESCTSSDFENIKVVEADSREHKKLYLSTKVYITNDGFPTWAEKRPGQTWINVWHGAINYKHIGYNYIVTRSYFSEKLFRLSNRQPDYFIAASRAFADDTAESFELDRSIFLEYGLPRNDLFFKDTPQLQAKIREALGIAAHKKVAMFAPTFRIGWKTSNFGLDFEQLRASLAKRFGGEWEILFRNHNFIKGREHYDGVIDASDYEDMNELLLISDVLLSDYSSCMYDFSLQRKPCFVYAPDIESYASDERGFAIPMSEWPYPIAESNEELSKLIAEFDENTYRESLEQHFAKLGAADDGHATDRVIELISKLMS